MTEVAHTESLARREIFRKFGGTRGRGTGVTGFYAPPLESAGSAIEDSRPVHPLVRSNRVCQLRRKLVIGGSSIDYGQTEFNKGLVYRARAHVTHMRRQIASRSVFPSGGGRWLSRGEDDFLCFLLSYRNFVTRAFRKLLNFLPTDFPFYRASIVLSGQSINSIP